MVGWILKKILGSKNQREIKRLMPTVRRINEFDEQFKALSDDELRAKTAAWKAELAAISELQDQWAKLDEILPEAFAVVKNAARRLTERQQTFTVCDQPMTWNMVHFDVQLVGGIVLHRGRISEMATGEGKTLVATLPLYLNALTGKGAHLVTVNDYLARRDAEWMGELYRFLGLTCGCIQHDQPPDIRREQYAMDITYGTNSEFGFDYLRDNGMATTREQQVQRGYNYAIVDEVDSILIDEARTPLIISGPSTVSTHQYDKWKPLVEQLVRKQTMLANRIASEAAELFEREKVEDFVPKEAAGMEVSPSVRKLASELRVHLTDVSATGKDGQITENDVRYQAAQQDPGLFMFKVKLAQPRNKPLLRMMEDPEKRKALEKAELSFFQDTRKEELFALKEELFFTIDEKSNESDLSEQGRAFLNPDEPDSFVLPDLISEFTEIDLDPGAFRRRERESESRAPATLRCAGGADSQHLATVARLLPFRERRRLRHRGKQSRYRRRIHRPQNAGPPLERRVAPGGRSEGRRPDRSGNADPRDDHDPELLPALPQTRRHDRYRRHRSGRVSRHLQAGRERHSDEPAGRTQGRKRSHLQDASRKIQRRHQRDQGMPRAIPAGPGRHRERGGVRVAQPDAEARKDSAQRSQRQIPHAGGGDRAARGSAGHGDNFDEHGWPRHRY